MIPYHLVLTLDPYTIASLVLGDFDDAFMNTEIDVTTARGFNRHFVGQFSQFDTIRHLIAGRDELVADMTWAMYDVVEETNSKITFQRRH